MLRIRPVQLQILTEAKWRLLVRKLGDQLRMTRSSDVEKRFGDDGAALGTFVRAVLDDAAGQVRPGTDEILRLLEERLQAPGAAPRDEKAPIQGDPAPEYRITDPVETMPRQTLACRFVETRGHCGVKAHVDVETRGIPDGTAVEIEILRITDSFVLAKIDGTLKGRVTRFGWYPTWSNSLAGHDGFIVQARTADLLANGPEIFAFEIDPPIAPEPRSVDRRDDFRAWTGRYRISYDGSKVLIKTSIRLLDTAIPTPAPAGDPTLASEGTAPVPLAAQIKSEVEMYLSDRYGFVQASCRLGKNCTCVKPITFRLDFVDQGEDHTAYQGALGAPANPEVIPAACFPRNRMWRAQWAHVVGHLLGWPDTPDDPAGLMGAGNALRPEYFSDIEHLMTTRTSQSWTLIPLDGPAGRDQ